jgi:signal transduction histidine kinase
VRDETAARDYFALIASESERLARLVNNVLDFSRIERGKKTFEMRAGDPAPVVREAAEMLRPYLREKGLRLEIDVPEKLPMATFDRDALVQILVNLIDNASKHGKEEVRVEAATAEGGVVLRVLDRGPGVPPEERERIFDPFTRGANAASGGSGLGLALVRHYALAHRGRVEVADREGGGAVFSLLLPAA